MKEIRTHDIILKAKESGVLSEYLTCLQNVKRLSLNTSYGYYMMTRDLAKFLSHKRHNMDCHPSEVILSNVSAEDMQSITEDEWNSYFSYRAFQNNDSENTEAVRITVLRNFYIWLASEMGRLPPAFIDSETRPKLSRKPVKKISKAKEELLCKTLDGENKHRNVCIVRLILHCGLGLNEICALDMEDINVDSITISKNGEKREIPLDDVSNDSINRYLAERKPPLDGSNALFVTSDTKRGRLRRGAIEKMLRKVVEASGSTFADITIRDMQNTAKQRFIEEHGADGAHKLTGIDSIWYFKSAYGQSVRQEACSAS